MPSKLISDYSRDVLSSVSRAPVPSLSVNPGVHAKLVREGLVETVDLVSPFASHKGKRICHLRITAAGEAELKAS